MSSIGNMANKMRENLSPMYDSPTTFWLERLRINEAKLWQRRVESAQRKVNYCSKRLAGAKTPSGITAPLRAGGFADVSIVGRVGFCA